MEKERCPLHNIPLIPTDCRRCHGDGMIEDDRDEFGGHSSMIPCWECGGSGEGFPDCELCLQEEWA